MIVSTTTHGRGWGDDAEPNGLAALTRSARAWLITLSLLLVLIWIGIGAGIAATQRKADPGVHPAVTRLTPQSQTLQSQDGHDERLGSEGPRS